MPIRFATPQDLPRLHPVIERAYRGETARKSWAIEAPPPSSPRTSIPALEAILATPTERLLVATMEDGTPIGCVQISDRGEGRSYLGLLCIDPDRQSAGLGSQLVAAAEHHAAILFGARLMEMTVIDSHSKLIQYYQRLGYHLTGERQPYPVPLDPPYAMLVLAKALAA
ncbi:GNAT family N-acetyltransferase [Sphingobium sp. Sx8-8]|uniref:GNAT family N-acetyltransferase n=1 Tax=Sphingobium sp. Sx8-8 TaxID=2933617 RepID=UPI001F5AD99B|nr:GNAT family N-acetyltransferase [Sphingobium sp. Sx8-8]